jgi:trk system potassium uptake protein TrkH
MEWSFITALFTAASAVSVTGLTVVDTGTYWSAFGEGVILALIQLGGLGIMTASMLILIILRRPISFRNSFELREMSGMPSRQTVSGIVLVTVLLTLTLEAVGMVLLAYRMGGLFFDGTALWLAAFLSVSSFNNAGFDNLGGSTSLIAFAHDWIVILIVGVLAVLGSLGPLVIIDSATKRSWRRLSPVTRIVLTASGLLFFAGFLTVFAVEYGQPSTLGPFNVINKVTNALFQGGVTRTAGLNTVPIGAMRDETHFLLMLLMFIGGATGSTAGGIKVATAAVLLLAMRAGIQGTDTVSGFGRRFNPRVIYRALAIVALAVLVIFLGTFVLIITEDFAFRHVLFEVVSAFATAGASTGITAELSFAGKLTIVVLMFVGRLGPLTLAYALAQRSQEARYRLPEEDIPIG